MENVLNQEEIDAIVQRARGGQLDAPQRQVVESWDIRQAGQIGSE